MSECADGVYLVDVGVRRAGYVVAAIGVVLVLGGLVPLLGWQVYAVAPLPALAGISAIVGGIRLLRVPSTGAFVSVDGEGVRMRRGEHDIRIAWSEVDRWGVASRRAFGANSRFTQLLVWPSESVAHETWNRARPLWRADQAAWAVTTYDPAPELVAAFDRMAPRPRGDAIQTSDW